MTSQTTMAGLALALAAIMTTAAEWSQWRGPAGLRGEAGDHKLCRVC